MDVTVLDQETSWLFEGFEKDDDEVGGAAADASETIRPQCNQQLHTFIRDHSLSQWSGYPLINSPGNSCVV